VFVNIMTRRVEETVSASVSLIYFKRKTELSTWASVCSGFGRRNYMLYYVSPQFTNHQWIKERKKKARLFPQYGLRLGTRLA
jgi:hypothetical protein